MGDMNRIADKNGGLMISKEWLGNKAKYDFIHQDGRKFKITAEHLKNIGWPKNLDLFFRYSAINPHKEDIHLNEIREIAESNGGKLLSSKWEGRTAIYRFEFADGRDFKMRASILKANGWPKDPDFYLRMSTGNPKRESLHLNDMRMIAEANNGKLLSSKWSGIRGMHHFEFEDGRDFWTTKQNLVNNGWPTLKFMECTEPESESA